MAEERQDYILALYLARYAGLRIHECFRMNAAATERALRENTLTVRGEGGKVRIVPIEDDRITMMLQRLLEKTERGHKLLVPDGVPTDRAIAGMQQFILRHRNAICDPTAPDRRITFHGLRHTFATLSLKYGVDVKTLSGALGHCDAGFTLSTYTHATEGMKRFAADTIGSVISQTMQPTNIVGEGRMMPSAPLRCFPDLSAFGSRFGSSEKHQNAASLFEDINRKSS